MYYVYLISSLKKNWIYVGFSKDIERRIAEHNSGEVRSTKAYRTFELIFVQVVNDRNEARDLEKYFKVRWNKESFLDIIKPEWRNWQTRMI